MANKKFSEFTLKTDPADVDFVVGYDGTDNVRIDPANIGGGNPAGSDTQLQYNNGGAFGAIPGFTYNDTNDRLIIDTTRVVFGDASGSSFQNGLTIWDDVEFRGNKFELSDGSATNPILTFFNTGDNNTGMFRPGSDIIAFATGGQEEFRIGANGEIGLSGANFGTAGQVLTSNGSGSGASWTTVSGGASDLNGLSDCLNYTNSNGNSLFLGNVPSNLSSPPLASRDLVIGIEAGNSMTGSTSCVFLGYRAAKNITTTNSTVAIGSSAMRDVTGSNGTQAVAIGLSAMVGSAGGLNTVSIGCQSGLYLDASNSVVIGANAAQGGYFSHITGTNLLVLGYQADPSTATVSNEITLGNSSITALRCAVTSITSLSDERDKTDIKDLEYGLAFIDALQPREFVWDNRPETRTETDEEGNETEVEFYSDNKGKKDFGFIAQEVRELDNDTLRLVYTENEEKLELSYGKLVPILVKAIQELKEEVELLKG